MFPEQIETDRLVLEQFSRDNTDIQQLYELYSDDEDNEDVFEYVPQEPHETIKDTYNLLDQMETRWADAEGARYIIRPQDGQSLAGEMAGIADLHCRWNRRIASLGFILQEPFWGNGYAGESGTALIQLAFDRLDFELVELSYQDGNRKSEHAVGKLVDKYEGQYEGLLRNWTPINGTVVNVHRHTITSEEYRKSTAE